MKKISKLTFAFAAIAFASCVNDDIIKIDTAEHSKDALKIVAEDLDGNATRAGGISHSTKGSVKLAWTANDVVRVYDETLSMWDKYQYNVKGNEDFTTNAAWFEPNVAGAPKKLESFSLAIFPADEVEAVYVDKDDRSIKHIEMTLPTDYDYSERIFDDDKLVGYRADLPMYGNVENTFEGLTAQMNYMTAMVRINIKDIPKDIKYLVLVSDEKPLAGRFTSDVPYPVEIGKEPYLFENELFKDTYTKAITAHINPKAYDNAKDSAGIFLPIPALVEYERLTLFGVKDSKTVEADMAAAGDDIAKWDELLEAGKAIEIETRAGHAEDGTIVGKGAWTPSSRKAGWWIQYTNTYYLDVDTIDTNREGKLYPGVLTKALEGKKATAIKNLTIKPYGKGDKVLYASEGYEYNHIVTIPKMLNGADVTLDLSEVGINFNENLTFKGEGFTGKLTVIQGHDGSDKQSAKWEIDLPNADVVIYTGSEEETLNNIDVQRVKTITIGDADGTTQTFTSAKAGTEIECKDFTEDHNVKFLTLRAGVAYIQDGVTVEYLHTNDNYTNGVFGPSEIVVYGGATVNNLDNNTLTDITLEAGPAWHGKEGERTWTTKLAKVGTLNVEHVKPKDTDEKKYINVKSTGQAEIATITVANHTNSHGIYEYLKITSVETYVNEKAAKPELAKAPITDGKIYTAAQLANLTRGAASYATTLDRDFVVMADEIDLSNVIWVPINKVHTNAAAKSFEGFNRNVLNAVTASNRKKNCTKTGRNVITGLTLDGTATNNVQAGQGLFGIVGGDYKISGITLESPKYEAVGNGINNVGALIGYFYADETTLTLANDTVLNAKLVNGNGTTSEGTGGMIGTVKAALKDLNITDGVVTGSQISGHYFIGGYIGKISGTIWDKSNVTFTNCSADVATLRTTTDPTIQIASNKAGTLGGFIGGTTSLNKLILTDCKHGTLAFTNDQTKKDYFFERNVCAEDLEFYGGNPWVGFSGESTVKYSNIRTFEHRKNGNSKTKNVYYLYNPSTYNENGVGIEWGHCDNDWNFVIPAVIPTNHKLFYMKDGHGFNIYKTYDLITPTVHKWVGTDE